MKATSRKPAPAGACLICEAWALGDLCPAHQALAERRPPDVLVKRTPPKPESER